MRIHLRVLGIGMLLSIILLAPVYFQNISESEGANLEISATSSTPATPAHTPTPSPLADAAGPWTFPPQVNPLTGLAVDDPAYFERRPMVVKISNAPPLVRPQAGISMADIVFEHYAEGGLTRFSAVFYGQIPERAGSIRSARLIDHELTAMFHGILAFSGASIGVEKYIYGSEDVHARIEGSELTAPGGEIPPSEYAQRAYKGIWYGPPYYWRDETIPVPHNLFANPRAIWELAAAEGHAQRPPLRGLAFHPAPPATVQASSGPATDIDIRYRATRVRWIYNAATGLYERYADGQGHYDAHTGQQVTAANVVVMYAEHTDTNIIESQWQDSISWSTQIAVWGQNPVIVFRDGQRYDGYWIRTIREDLIALRTPDHDLLYLKPGNTWFQIIRMPEQQNPDEEWLIVE